VWALWRRKGVGRVTPGRSGRARSGPLRYRLSCAGHALFPLPIRQNLRVIPNFPAAAWPMPADGGRGVGRRAGSTVAEGCNSVASSRGGYAMPWPQSGRRGRKGHRHVLPARSDQPSVGARCCAQKVPVPFSLLVASGLLLSFSGCQTGRISDGSAPHGPLFSHCDARAGLTTTPHGDEAGLAVADDRDARDAGRATPVLEVARAAPTGAARPSTAKPELLAWRTRLRDRISARVLGRKPSPSLTAVKPPQPQRSLAREGSATQDESTGRSTLIVRASE
jgi:hypothetical protein